MLLITRIAVPDDDKKDEEARVRDTCKQPKEIFLSKNEIIKNQIWTNNKTKP